METIRLFFRRILWALFSLCLTGFFIGVLILIYLESRLPSIDTIKSVQVQIPLRVYTRDGQLIGSFGEKRRVPVTLDKIPQPLINAVLATEDQRFFDHSGVDLIGLTRAAVELIRTGTKSQGGSTITMQVARNFFLTRKKSYIRKLNEVLLALKIDRVLSKDKILELYLNKIYFGNRAYGVAAAAEAYYGKTLSDLTLPEMAMLAGLPKAPSALNPVINPTAAKERRNHVLERMLKLKYIDEATYKPALNTPLTASYHEPLVTVKAPYVAEMVRQMLFDRMGERAYTEGYKIYTTVDPQLQSFGNRALRNALINYDKRHGYRGVKINLLHTLKSKNLETWIPYLKKLHTISGLRPAVVLTSTNRTATAILSDGKQILIDWPGISWTGRGSANFLKTGDVIRVALQTDGTWRLAQVPRIEGAIVAVDPMDGAIKALSGGFNFASSNFNRATQALRQPGSSFKPFIYSAALEKGFTLASIINDAPIVINDPSLPTLWRPQNDSRKFYGPTRLRIALAYSRNLVSIRLLQTIGISYTVKFIQRFGFPENQLPKSLSLALGTGSATPLQMASGFAVFANGGYRVSPYIIDHIDDNHGKTVLMAKPRTACEDCTLQAPRAIPEENAFLMNSVLKDVIQIGTGRAAKILNRNDIAGKTGTSDDKKDAWFIGFNGDLSVACWVGYDQPRSSHEYGAQAALPMWIDFMRNALQDKPENSLDAPDGVSTVSINPNTGSQTADNQEGSIQEFAREEDLSHLSGPIYAPGSGGDAAVSDSEHLF